MSVWKRRLLLKIDERLGIVKLQMILIFLLCFINLFTSARILNF